LQINPHIRVYLLASAALVACWLPNSVQAKETGRAGLTSSPSGENRLTRVQYRFQRTITQDAITQFFGATGNELQIPADLQFSLKGTISVPGGKHIRVQQAVDRIPVFGAEMVISLDQAGQVTTVSNGFRTSVAPHAPETPLPAETAIRLAREFVGVKGRMIDDTESAEMVYLPDSIGGLHLSYRVLFVCSEPLGDWEIFVDATSGRILRHADRFVHYQSVEGTGYVFLPDPISHARASYGARGFSDNNDLDSDSLNACRSLVRLDSITFDNGRYILEGPACRITDVEAPYGDDYSALSPDGFMFSRNEQGFEAVNAYYHITESYRYIRSLGFALTSPEKLRVDPHGFAGQDNSHYSPTGNWIGFGEGGVDDAEDAGVIWHEYAHAIQYSIIPTWGGGESQALGEGFSDYWAASHMSALGQWGHGDDQQSWLFLWDGHNEYWRGRRTDDDRTYPFTGMGTYEAGQVWSSALMDIHRTLGREITDRIVLKSIYYLGYGTTAPEAAEAILQADRDLYGGAHIPVLAYWLGTVKKFIDPAAVVPVITHTPISPGTEGAAEIRVSAGITANAGLLSSTVMVMWKVDDGDYASAIMVPEEEGVSYSALIPIPQTASTFSYYIVATDANGVVGSSPIDAPATLYQVDLRSGEDDQPAAFSLEQNYPNPFNPSTTITYSLSEDARVHLTVFNVVGQEVSTLESTVKGRGTYAMVWNGTDSHGREVSSGTYFYRILVEPLNGNSRFVEIRKMMFLH
jgi:hypothetical protein